MVRKAKRMKLSKIRDFSAEINSGDKDEDDTAKVSATHTTVLETSQTLCDYFQFDFESERTFSHLDEFKKTFKNLQKQTLNNFKLFCEKVVAMKQNFNLQMFPFFH